MPLHQLFFVYLGNKNNASHPYHVHFHRNTNIWKIHPNQADCAELGRAAEVGPSYQDFLNRKVPTSLEPHRPATAHSFSSFAPFSKRSNTKSSLCCFFLRGKFSASSFFFFHRLISADMCRGFCPGRVIKVPALEKGLKPPEMRASSCAQIKCERGRQPPPPRWCRKHVP